MNLNLIDTPTAGKRVRVETVFTNWHFERPEHELLQEKIQELADEGWDFAGIIDERQGGTASACAVTKTLLFVRGAARANVPRA